MDNVRNIAKKKKGREKRETHEKHIRTKMGLFKKRTIKKNFRGVGTLGQDESERSQRRVEPMTVYCSVEDREAEKASVE